MGFLKNIAQKAARKTTVYEFERLKAAIEQFPERSIGDIFQATANLGKYMAEKLPNPHNVTFTAALTLPRVNFQENERLRQDVARLLPILTELSEDSENITTKWGIYFWRVVFMTMLHDELYDDARKLWKVIKKREKTEGRPLRSLRPIYYKIK
jgi:hypothetical protein